MKAKWASLCYNFLYLPNNSLLKGVFLTECKRVVCTLTPLTVRSLLAIAAVMNMLPQDICTTNSFTFFKYLLSVTFAMWLLIILKCNKPSLSWVSRFNLLCSDHCIYYHPKFCTVDSFVIFIVFLLSYLNVNIMTAGIPTCLYVFSVSSNNRDLCLFYSLI